MRSGHITYQIMAFSLLILSLILAWIRAETWVIAMISLLFVFQWLVGVIMFHWLERGCDQNVWRRKGRICNEHVALRSGTFVRYQR